MGHLIGNKLQWNLSDDTTPSFEKMADILFQP